MIEATKGINVELWVFTAIIIGMVIVQALLFLRLTLRFNGKHKLVTKEETRMAVRTGIITCIGTAGIPVNTLALIAMVGSAVTFMRCGVIGSPGWELMMAEVASSAVGVDFGSPEFTTNVLVLCLFCMVLGSAPYFINCILALKPLDKMVEKNKKSEKKVSFMPYLGKASMMGLITCMVFDNVNFRNPSKVFCFVFAIVISVILSKIARKTNSALLRSFVMPVGMISGMIVGQLFVTYFG